MFKHCFAICIVIFSANLVIFGQNRFEGYSIVVDAARDQRAATCAVRYVPPQTNFSVLDTDKATASNVRSCGGGASLNAVQKSADGARFNANSTSNTWCFEAEDEMYRLTFPGGAGIGQVTYNWIAEKPGREGGFYNIREFGAAGDGRTDDTIAFKSAMAYMASKNGGTLTIPAGDYKVTSPIAIPSGIVIQGTNGLYSMAPTSHVPRKNPSRITLSGPNKALFEIGECVEGVTIRDIELYSESNVGTTAIDAFGAYNSSQGFVFERVAFNNFNRGINVEGLKQTNLNWQFDYVKVVNCRFMYMRDAGIHTNLRNSDWRVEGTVFINPPKKPGQNANSMDFERVGMVTIQDTFGGGFVAGLGGTFLNILDSGNITIIGSQTEQMTYSLVYNGVDNPAAGDYSYPITIVNSIFGSPMLFKARRTLVSTGSLYGGNTFQADERLRVYSTGDRFCYDGNILACVGAQENNFDKAKVIFMTGQPGEGKVKGHPTYFGTEVQFGAPVQMPTINANALPARAANGSMVFCANCRRNSSPCQAGGTGAPAMMIGGKWNCL